MSALRKVYAANYFLGNLILIPISPTYCLLYVKLKSVSTTQNINLCIHIFDMVRKLSSKNMQGKMLLINFNAKLNEHGDQ